MLAKTLHSQTKHFPNRFAKSLGYLDWENQPSYYKEYIAPKIGLDYFDINLSYERLYTKNKPSEINLKTIGTLLKNSLAINAIKKLYTSQWEVRVNPSSGNLHPEETYVIFENKITHFNVKDFSLEVLGEAKNDIIKNGIIVIFSSIPLREAWKYGERALRYCLLDSGHAIASLAFSANLLGLNITKTDHFAFKKLENKTAPNEEEYIENAFILHSGDYELNIDEFLNTPLNLKALPLAKDSIRWEVVYELFESFEKEDFSPKFINKEIKFLPSKLNAEEIIQNRRSALGFIPEYIDKRDLLDILDKTLPRNIPPFNTNAHFNNIDIVMFINRVNGLESGIYYYSRNNLLKHNFTQIEERLYLIEKGDFSEASKFINCTQDLGKQSSVSFSFVADFEKITKNYHYKLTLQEAGMVGHIIYLEAEAKGIRGCGIGCFFDDLINNEILDGKLQAVYNFTVGVPLIDERIIKVNPKEAKNYIS